MDPGESIGFFPDELRQMDMLGLDMQNIPYRVCRMKSPGGAPEELSLCS